MDSELSNDANRLLQYLQTFARFRSTAKCDREIAAALNLPERNIIDWADELCVHGFAVAASCNPPMGRWLVHEDSPAEDWALGKHYGGNLRRRGGEVQRRADHFESAMRQTEARRRTKVEYTGQGRLF